MRRWLWLIALIWPLAATAAKPAILLIESYHTSFKWDEDYKRGLNAVLNDCCILNGFEMDTKRRAQPEHGARADLAWKEYLRLKPALVILADDTALRLLGPRFARTKTPVIFLGINNDPRRYFKSWPNNFTGVLERPFILRSILSIRRFLPATDKILVLFDNTHTSNITVQDVFRDRTHINVDGVQIELRMIEDWNEWKQLVLRAKSDGYDAIAVGLYQSVWNGKENVDDDKVIRWTSENSPLPIFSFWDFAVGRDKTIGSLVLRGYDQGLEAGVLALRVLKGESPAEIPLETGDRGQLVFSRTQLRRFGISLPRLIERNATFVD